MRKTSLDIGMNWVGWLQDQASRFYIWDGKAQYHRVVDKQTVTDIPPARTLRDAWQTITRQCELSPNLHGNLFVRELQHMPVSARARISAFFSAQGLRDFRFLDHGGRAITYRALHVPTGQIRVARMEAPHCSRMIRPDHPVVLQPFATNEGRIKAYGDIKLEVLPEVVPLSRLLPALEDIRIVLLKEVFQDAVLDLARGTNMMYSRHMYDRDAEPQNVGLLPDGRIVSFDPEVITGPRAAAKHRRASTPALLFDANAQQLQLIYPGFR